VDAYVGGRGEQARGPDEQVHVPHRQVRLNYLSRDFFEQLVGCAACHSDGLLYTMSSLDSFS
jgi:hypothetical protein